MSESKSDKGKPKIKFMFNMRLKLKYGAILVGKIRNSLCFLLIQRIHGEKIQRLFLKLSGRQYLHLLRVQESLHKKGV